MYSCEEAVRGCAQEPGKVMGQWSWKRSEVVLQILTVQTVGGRIKWRAGDSAGSWGCCEDAAHRWALYLAEEQP